MAKLEQGARDVERMRIALAHEESHLAEMDAECHEFLVRLEAEQREAARE